MRLGFAPRKRVPLSGEIRGLESPDGVCLCLQSKAFRGGLGLLDYCILVPAADLSESPRHRSEPKAGRL